MALVHRHLAGGAPSGRPADGKGRGLHQATGRAVKRRVAIMAQRQGVSGAAGLVSRSDGGPGGIRGETPCPTGKEAGPGS